MTNRVYLMNENGPQGWMIGEDIEHEPGCGCTECITDPADAPAVPAVIRNGSVVQYRKVGKATVRFHECPAEYRCERGTGTHQYLVHFRTGRYAGTSRHVWLDQGDVIEAMV